MGVWEGGRHITFPPRTKRGPNGTQRPRSFEGSPERYGLGCISGWHHLAPGLQAQHPHFLQMKHEPETSLCFQEDPLQRSPRGRGRRVVTRAGRGPGGTNPSMGAFLPEVSASQPCCPVSLSVLIFWKSRVYFQSVTYFFFTLGYLSIIKGSFQNFVLIFVFYPKPPSPGQMGTPKYNCCQWLSPGTQAPLGMMFSRSRSSISSELQAWIALPFATRKNNSLEKSHCWWNWNSSRSHSSPSILHLGSESSFPKRGWGWRALCCGPEPCWWDPSLG